MKKLFVIALIGVFSTSVEATVLPGIVGPQFRIVDSTANGKITYEAGTFSESMVCGGKKIYSHGGKDVFIAAYDNQGAVLFAFAVGTKKDDEVRSFGFLGINQHYPMFVMVSAATMSDSIFCGGSSGDFVISPINQTKNTVGELMHYISYDPYTPGNNVSFSGISTAATYSVRATIIPH